MRFIIVHSFRYFSAKSRAQYSKFLDKLITSESCENALLTTTEIEDIECRKTTLNEDNSYKIDFSSAA